MSRQCFQTGVASCPGAIAGPSLIPIEPSSKFMASHVQNINLAGSGPSQDTVQGIVSVLAFPIDLFGR